MTTSRLHPVAAQALEEARESGRVNAHLLPVQEARARFESEAASIPLPDIAVVRELRIPARDGVELPARLLAVGDGPGLPLVVYFHGGGWLLGSIDSHDVVARKLATAIGGAVLSVGYRRAPESRFPTATDDAVDALAWAASHASDLGAEGGKLVVAGDSAGGNLAAVAAIRCRDEGGPAVRHQLLVYPVTTCDLSIGVDSAWDGVVLHRDELQWHQDNYLDDPASATDPHVAPLLADLAGLPSATIVLGECDPIGPQGRLYAAALEAAGVRVELREYATLPHGFFGLDSVFPEAGPAMAFAGRSVRAALGLAG